MYTHKHTIWERKSVKFYFLPSYPNIFCHFYTEWEANYTYSANSHQSMYNRGLSDQYICDNKTNQWKKE